MRKSLVLSLFFCSLLPAQQLTAPTELGGKPFYVKNTWVIGGEGNWDQMAMDPTAGRLYIAHGHSVQVVNAASGELLGSIDHLQAPRSIVLDGSGAYGFIGDTQSGAVVVFDRDSLRFVAAILTSAPRILAYDPLDKLLFAIPYYPPNATVQTVASHRDANGTRFVDSISPVTPDWSQFAKNTTDIAVIDTEKLTVVGHLLFSSQFNAALTDERGQLYLSDAAHNTIVHLDVEALASSLHKPGAPFWADWTSYRGAKSAPANLETFPLKSTCKIPISLAVDSRQQRLFVGCENGQLAILNTQRGEQIASLPLSHKPQSLAFVPDSNLIFAGDDGKLTVVHQHITDSYAIQQELPTSGSARSLAVNPLDGAVFLASQPMGFDLSKPGGIGKLETAPIKGSFQILQIGN